MALKLNLFNSSRVTCPDCGRSWPSTGVLKVGDSCLSDDCPSNEKQFNCFQKLVLELYENGAHSVQKPSDLPYCEDGLLAFILTELSTREECTNLDIALNRLDVVIKQLHDLKAGMSAQLNQVSKPKVAQLKHASLAIASANPYPQGLFDEIVKQMKSEILDDIKAGVVPSDVKSFSKLHDYVDANSYGGFCDDSRANALIKRFGGRDENDAYPDALMQLINDAQNAIDKWIREDGINLIW